MLKDTPAVHSDFCPELLRPPLLPETIHHHQFVGHLVELDCCLLSPPGAFPSLSAVTGAAASTSAATASELELARPP